MHSTSSTNSSLSLARAHLEIVEGPGLGRKIPLREGQVRYVGRTSQADDSCPENPTMSSVHFSVRWFAGKCELKDLNSANGTFRHGKKVTEALLNAGDEIKAGKATFRLVVDDGTGGASYASVASISVPKAHDTDFEPHQHEAHVPASVPPAEAHIATGLAIVTTAKLPAEAQLGDEAKAMLTDDMPVPQFLELLVSHEHYLDALRTVAHSLAKRSAVQWACQCVRSACGDDLNKTDQAALQAAEAWAADPNEENRRKAQAAAENAGHSTAASWTAMAAFFSSGSLGPSTAPVVPPAPHLTSHAAAGAAMLAAVARQPEKAPERYEAFIKLAKEHMK
jgi:pSer/pThr/pTyr-binding forkhead associated (FHA) protein